MRRRLLTDEQANRLRQQYHLGRRYRPKCLCAAYGISQETLRKYLHKEHRDRTRHGNTVKIS